MTEKLQNPSLHQKIDNIELYAADAIYQLEGETEQNPAELLMNILSTLLLHASE